MDAADNVDLLRILAEWEERQEARWGCRPKLTRPVGGGPADGACCCGGADAGRAANRPAAGPGRGAPPFSGQMAARQRRERAAAAAAEAKAQPGACGEAGGAAAAAGRSAAAAGAAAARQRGDAGSDAGAGAAAGDQRLAAGGAPEPRPPLIAVEGRGCQAQQGADSGGPLGAPEDEGGPSDPPVGPVPVSRQQSLKARHPCRSPLWLPCAVAAACCQPSNCCDRPLFLRCPQPSLQGELRELALALCRDALFRGCPGVAWGDVAGLDDAKQLLQEAVVAPLRWHGRVARAGGRAELVRVWLPPPATGP
jgi:katanin p60 ATPase-containing subunit A1